MQIKATMRYHLTPAGMPIIKKYISIDLYKTNIGEDVDKKELLCIVGGNVNWCSHYENSMEAPQKIKNRTTI